LGAELASKIIRRMAMSNFEGKVLVQFIRWHTYMAKLARVPKLDNGHLCSAGRRLGIVSIPVALFGAADLLAKKIDMAPDQLIYRNVTATINRFLKAHCFQRTEIIDPPLPVTGADLVAVLGIPPGRWVADTIIFLKEEVAAGRIAGRQEAINAAKKLNRYKYGK
ncbi:MAG: hypothetical protein Q8N36_06490, partial [bacterium]|nr:hypothetical protein [bacterium]